MRESKYFEALFDNRNLLVHIVNKGNGAEIARIILLSGGSQIQNTCFAMDMIEVIEKYQEAATVRR